MVKLTLTAMIFSIGTVAFAENEVTGCTNNLIEKLEYHSGRAKKFCSKAHKVGTDSFQFSNCVIDIHTETKLAPEIIAPYCMKRPDVAYKDCVVSTFKSNSKENAFKSCLKKSSVASFRRHDIEKTRVATPSKVKISVGYVRDAYSLEN